MTARPSRPTPSYLFPAAIALLVAARLLLQFIIYRAGFRALTGDDFGRVIAAAQWALHPEGIWQGPWLPFYTYGLGALLRVDWDLYYLPRALALVFGSASLIIVGFLTARLFGRRITGVLAAALLGVNPAHLWLSQVPLTEIFFFALLAGAALAVVTWAHAGRNLWLAGATLLLTLASGVRVEGWLFAATLGAALVVTVVPSLRRGDWRGAWPRLAAAVALAVVPLTWLASNWAVTHDPLYFINVTRGFDQQWYGAAYTYQPYLQVAWRLDPLALILLPVALIFGLVAARRKGPLRWYLLLAVVPFALYAVLQGGQVQPPGNFIRYLAVFQFLFYPLLAGLLLWLVHLRPRLWPWPAAALALVVVWVAVRQVNAALQFDNDPAAGGLRAGQWLRQQGIDPSGPTVLLELNYWQYLAVHTGANDLTHMLYDRPLDFTHMNDSASLLAGNPDLLRACVAAYHLRYIVVAAPELRALVEDTLGITETERLDGYSVYRLTEPAPEAPAGVQCTLPLGTGY